MNIKPGILVKHLPTGRVYIIEAIGKMRLAGGDWVEAARYSQYSLPSPGPEYYRPSTDFATFEEVSNEQRTEQPGQHVGGTVNRAGDRGRQRHLHTKIDGTVGDSVGRWHGADGADDTGGSAAVPAGAIDESRVKCPSCRGLGRTVSDYYVPISCGRCGGRGTIDLVAEYDNRPDNDARPRDLMDLLAIIHRDGGQYVQQHGLEKAVQDAEARVLAWLAREDEQKLGKTEPRTTPPWE